MKIHFNKLLFCLMALSLITNKIQAEILLVNLTGSGGTRLLTVSAGDWTTAAYPTLQDALDAAVTGDQIWVRQGTYLPTKNAAPLDNRTKTFKIPNGVSLYGGFLATETVLTARNATTNVTTLSGDIGVAGTDTDNSYNVVVISGNATDTRLDGFTVEKGYDDRVSKQQGIGILIFASRVIIDNCIVKNNVGRGDFPNEKFGIGIYANGTLPGATPQLQILNSTISNNIGAAGGAGINADYNGTGLIRNCIIQNNIAVSTNGLLGSGGGLQLEDDGNNSIVFLENSLVTNNAANGTFR